MTDAEREMAADSWRRSMAPLLERRTGPRTVALGARLAPASEWNPMLAGIPAGAGPGPLRARAPAGPRRRCPRRDDAIAFAPVTHLSRWIERRQLTSERLTGIYLDRIERFDPKLRCVITLTRDSALAQAKAGRRRDRGREVSRPAPRHPLRREGPARHRRHRDHLRAPSRSGTACRRADAVVVRRLNDAGAVLVAKLSLGALALNDIWFGGQTMNPWLLEEGASGSSAGPGRRDGGRAGGLLDRQRDRRQHHQPEHALRRHRPAAHLRPGARTGAMTLCWSLDKLGPMTRGVEDAMLVLQAITGPDAGRRGERAEPARLRRTAQSVAGLKVGYFPAWMKEAPATDVDRAALETVGQLGMVPTEVSFPDWPYGSLSLMLFAEAAAAFEELTLSGRDDQLTAQVPDAWPNLFRESRFLSAVDFVQADRLRRRVAGEMARVFSEVDLLLVPSLRDEMLTISNFTGHPSLTLRAGFVDVAEARSDWAPDPTHPLPTFSPPRRVPHGVTLIGRLFDEGTIGRVGLAHGARRGVSAERPAGF